MAPIIEIFCFIDDFCKLFNNKSHYFLPNPLRQRQTPCSMSLSEIMTIMVLFHLSHYRTFKDFYLNYLCVYMHKDFPKLVSYQRFIELMPHALMPLVVLVHACFGKETGHYFIDSTKLPVCHNLRIYRHKVFKGLASRGKTSTGWFFGFKLHLILNDQGEIIRFSLTSGNKDDRSIVQKLTQTLQGWIFGDKGYISKKLKDSLLKQGLHLITRVRKNMKENILSSAQKFYLGKRGIIETVIDQLKAIFHIQHTRHRSPINFLVNLISGLLAYTLTPKKPSVRFDQLRFFSNTFLLTSN